MNDLYIALDGDNVGQRLEYYSFTNNLDELKAFSQVFSERMRWLQDELISKFEAEIIFCGGDNLMASLRASTDFNDLLKSLIMLFREFQSVGNTISAGIGNSPREAFIALNFAKSSGKDCIKFYGDYTNDEK